MEPQPNNLEPNLENPALELSTNNLVNNLASNLISDFAAIADHCFECGVCGYIYEPKAGDTKSRIREGTTFVELPNDWRCPVCTAKKDKFSDIGLSTKPSGFTENLGYGLGVNTLTPGQKNLLIFGGLALGFIFFLSFYAID